jgi:hypothetical protein
LRPHAACRGGGARHLRCLGASSPLGSERPLLMATLATAQPTGEERTHRVPSRSPWSPGGFKPAKASAPPRRRRRDCHRRAAQPAGEHRQRQSCWRPRPRSKAGGRGECRTRSRSCLDHADQGVPTRRLASRSPISVQHRRQSRCRGCRPWPSPARCSFTTGSPADQAPRRSTTCRERADPQARRRGPWTVSSRVEVAGAHLPDVGCPAVGFKR